MLQETEPNPSTLGSSHQTATYTNLRRFVRVVSEKTPLQRQLKNSPKKFGASTSAASGTFPHFRRGKRKTLWRVCPMNSDDGAGRARFPCNPNQVMTQLRHWIFYVLPTLAPSVPARHKNIARHHLADSNESRNLPSRDLPALQRSTEAQIKRLSYYPGPIAALDRSLLQRENQRSQRS
jgi:hypothetical protein